METNLTYVARSDLFNVFFLLQILNAFELKTIMFLKRTCVLTDL